jgi:DNA-binding IclR family transcriptional regulator
MAARGYAARNPISGSYRLGPKIGELHAAYLTNRRLGRDASILLDRLAAETGETALLTAFEGGEAVYIDKVESEHPLRTSSRIGQRGPLHAGAAGKSILAVLNQSEVDRLLGSKPLERFGPNSVIDRAARLCREHRGDQRGDRRRGCGAARPGRVPHGLDQRHRADGAVRGAAGPGGCHGSRGRAAPVAGRDVPR